MSDDLGKEILKGVSRSFYLTLRLLPAPMRGGASLGYLLARTSDTIADTPGVPVADRLRLLARYADSVSGGGSPPVWPEPLLRNATAKERTLLENSPAIHNWLRNIDPREAELIREVVQIIISGQTLDLGRFGNATAECPIVLPDDSALDDYTFRVAGCVGAFWTKLGFLTMGGRYSPEKPEVLLEWGIRYGQGLQLVNILRDLPEDLAMGRCYLPVADPTDRAAIMAEFAVWHQRAKEWTSEGMRYSDSLKSRRLRAATVLPAMIAEETLALLEGASWKDLREGVKVPRSRIYRLLAESLFF